MPTGGILFQRKTKCVA